MQGDDIKERNEGGPRRERGGHSDCPLFEFSEEDVLSCRVRPAGWDEQHYSEVRSESMSRTACVRSVV